MIEPIAPSECAGQLWVGNCGMVSTPTFGLRAKPTLPATFDSSGSSLPVWVFAFQYGRLS